MAKARALDRRRKSIRNIRKITRTMELISTARFKQGDGPRRRGHGLYQADHRPGGPSARQRPGGQASALGRPAEDVEGRAAGALRQSRPVRRLQRAACCGRPDTSARSSRPSRAGGSPGSLRQAGHLGLPLPQGRDRRALHAVRGQAELRRGRRAGQPLPGMVRGPAASTGSDVAYTKFESLSRQHAVVETLLPLAALGRRGRKRRPERHRTVHVRFPPFGGEHCRRGRARRASR